jgi:hypothetical protein
MMNPPKEWFNFECIDECKSCTVLVPDFACRC